MYYADPVKLDASERTVEFSAELCQQRCQGVPECSHFTFWPDPGTIWDHLGRSGTIWDLDPLETLQRGLFVARSLHFRILTF